MEPAEAGVRTEQHRVVADVADLQLDPGLVGSRVVVPPTPRARSPTRPVAALRARWRRGAPSASAWRRSSGVVEDAFDDATGATGDAAVVVAQRAVRAVQ